MQAGRLRERVTLQYKEVTKGSMGEESPTWLPVAGSPIRAEVVPLGGREVLAGAQINRVVDYRIRIRDRAGVTEDLRLVWHSKHGDVQLDIVSVLIGTNQYAGTLELLTIKGVRNGR